jgi:tetratricopeptide (TPR) repeat protein
VNLAMLYDNMTHDANSKIKTLSSQLGAGSSKVTSLGKELEAEKEKISIFDGEVKRIGALIKKQPSNADLKRQLKDVNDKREEAKAAITKIQADITAAEANAKSTDASALEKDLAKEKADRDQFAKLAVENYQKALEVDGKNVDALYNLGVFYFNDAVVLKSEVDNMNMTEYAQRGKEVEGRVCGRFQKAKPYFEKAIEVNGLADAKDNLETVNNILTQFESKGVKCIAE